MPVATEESFTTYEVAARLKMSVDWVRRTFGKRPGVIRLGGKNMRIPERVIAEFMKERNGTTAVGKKPA